jgi:hypothetical protein
MLLWNTYTHGGMDRSISMLSSLFEHKSHRNDSIDVDRADHPPRGTSFVSVRLSGVRPKRCGHSSFLPPRTKKNCRRQCGLPVEGQPARVETCLV